MKPLSFLVLILATATAEDEAAPLSEDPSVAAHVLASARKDIKASRNDFKALSPDERSVIKGAREAVASTPGGTALAPAFGAAADLLDAAGNGDGDAADLCRHMAKSYRAMAEEIDDDASYLTETMKEQEPAERADATFAAAEKLLSAAPPESVDEAAAASWATLKRSDPRMRALALNTKTLARGFVTLAAEKPDEKIVQAVAKAEKLQKALEPYFEGVRTSKRDEPEPEPPPKPKGPRVIIPLR